MAYLNGKKVFLPIQVHTEGGGAEYITGYITNGLIYDFSLQKYPTYDEVSGQILSRDTIRTSVNATNDIIYCENAGGGFKVDSAPLIYGLTSFSMSIWFTYEIRGIQWIFVTGRDASLKMAGLLLDTTSLNYNAYSDDVKSQIAPNANEWCHACLVQDGTTAKIYVNGELKNSKTMSVTIDGNAIATQMGFALDYASRGKSANFLIYNRALTDTEVLQNYNATKGYFQTGTNTNTLSNEGDTGGVSFSG